MTHPLRRRTLLAAGLLGSSTLASAQTPPRPAASRLDAIIKMNQNIQVLHITTKRIVISVRRKMICIAKPVRVNH